MDKGPRIFWPPILLIATVSIVLSLLMIATIAVISTILGAYLRLASSSVFVLLLTFAGILSMALIFTSIEVRITIKRDAGLDGISDEESDLEDDDAAFKKALFDFRWPRPSQASGSRDKPEGVDVHDHDAIEPAKERWLSRAVRFLWSSQDDAGSAKETRM